MIAFAGSFDFKCVLFIYIIILEDLTKTSKGDTTVENLDIDNCIRNELFENQISEILIGEAPGHDFLIHFDSTSYEFIDGIIGKTNAKKNMIKQPKLVTISDNSTHSATTVMINYDKLTEL